MPDLYLGISHASYNILNIDTSDHLKEIDDFIKFSQLMYNKVAEKGDEVLKYAGRSVEFHSFGVVGAPGGEILAPMIWTMAHFGQFFAKITNAKNGLVISGVPSIIFATQSLEKVYTANTTPMGLSQDIVDWSQISNLEILSWDSIKNSLPELDMADILLNYLVDDDLTIAIAKAIKPGGMLVLSNASNASDLYNDFTQRTFPEYVHNLIMETGDFTSFHFQAYTSYTCYYKNS